MTFGKLPCRIAFGRKLTYVERERREDAIDAAIAAERLAEIAEHPERLIFGEALEARLRHMGY